MTTTTATTYGSRFSEQGQVDSILAYINGGDYTEDQQSALVERLMSELRTEVEDQLPDDVTWQPSTSEFLHPVDVDLPDREEMREIFESAWSAVERRCQEIETELFGSLPADLAGLEQELMAIAEPVHRARVAGLLTDAPTREMAARVRQEAIWQATRERGSAERVAELLDTGLPAIRKAIKEHNARYVI